MGQQVAINPATGETLHAYDEFTSERVHSIVHRVHEAFLSWRCTSFGERGTLMRRAAQVLRDGKADHARLMAREMGKPVRDGRAEIEKCACACEFYAEKAHEFLMPEIIETDASKSYVTFNPLGVILAIMPWNFPFWQVFRFAAPSLMAGNAAMLKHASNVPGCAFAIEETFKQAGFPQDLFRTLILSGNRAAKLITHPLIRGATLTGSVSAGMAVGQASGKAIKPSVLELGGSDPYIVLEDADVPAAAEICAASRLLNTGQTCIAAKRFIVVESVRAEFERLFVERMKNAKLGDPMDEATEIGPLARHDLRDELHEQVRRSIAAGARCLLGGKIPDGPGAYYPPTVLTDVRKGTPAYEEELFGPVAAIIAVKDEREAVRVANDTSFGLGAAVFTRDVKRGERIAAEELEAGCCFVNALVRSDPRLPFGGVKMSGYGRELSHYGIREFVNVKTVYVT